MTRCAALACLALLLSLAGCYRTVYMNLEPLTPADSTQTTPEGRRGRSSSWQDFFVYGWVPSERVIYAEKVCGIEGRVQEIRTRQSFLQGLVEAVASYGINIYSPYTGEVVCEGDYKDRR